MLSGLLRCVRRLTVLFAAGRGVQSRNTAIHRHCAIGQGERRVKSRANI
jgi:hypothetical protein